MDFAKIWILVDHDGNRPRQLTLEALELARSLAVSGRTSIEAVILGDQPGPIAMNLEGSGFDRLLPAEHAELAEYTPEAFCSALQQLIREEKPDLVLMGHTYQNMDMAPRLAARLGVPLLTDCVGFRRDDSGIMLTRQMFRNKLTADIRLPDRFPWLVTIQAGAFRAPNATAGTSKWTVVAKTLDLSTLGPRRELLEKVDLGKQRVDLSRAEVIVGVGRGIKKKENLPLVQDLADALGAEIGASRPVVDSSWLERDRQIGSSGQSVSPRLYIGIGVSGAIQHVVGMRNSSCIVAINPDRHAPIFNIAHYGVVGDFEKIVPELTARIRALKKA